MRAQCMSWKMEEFSLESCSRIVHRLNASSRARICLGLQVILARRIENKKREQRCEKAAS